MTVRIQPLDASATADVIRWRNDERIASQLFAEAGPTVAEHERFLETLAACGDREEYVIVADGRRVGTIGLSRIDRDAGVAEYGILLDGDYEGRGVAAQASELLLRRAFDELHLHNVVLELFADNARARRLYERLGFEATGRRVRVKQGAERETLVMTLTATRFHSRQGANA